MTCPQNIMLYWGDSSPCCWSVQIALEEKHLQGYRHKKLSFAKHEYRNPEVVALNPRAELPTCKIGDIVINESLAICQYLDDKNPNKGTRLIPENHELKALMWQRLCEFYWNFPRKGYKNLVSYLWTTALVDQNYEQVKTAKNDFIAELNLWEMYLKQTKMDGPYLLGKDFTLGDVVVFPWLAYMVEVGLNLTLQHPQLYAYYNAVKDRASVNSTWPLFEEKPNRTDNTLGDLIVPS